MNNKSVIETCARRYDSFYLYDENIIRSSLSALKANFPGIEFLYSIKCNPNPHVLRCVFDHGLGADAASLGEVMMADHAGLGQDQIFYSAPGKTVKEIEGAMTKATLIADSLEEIERIRQVAESAGMTVKIGLRINPDFTFTKEYGQASKFGIDEEQALRFLKEHDGKNIRVSGIHVHLKSQELHTDALASYYEKMLRLSERFSHVCGGLDYVNMGSGIGVPYTETDEPPDLSYLGSFVRKKINRFREKSPETRWMIEVGRYAICKSGVYVTKVLDRKVSRGKTYIILKNTLNGFMRPSLAMLVDRYAQETSQMPAEPLFTGPNAFQFLPLSEKGPNETVTLAGNLCTAADVIAEDVVMPHLECGDSIVITNAGSYAAVLSPMQFSTQEPPVELFLTQTGDVLERIDE